MISEAKFNKEIDLIITNAIREDVGGGDYSSLACIPDDAQGKALLNALAEDLQGAGEKAKVSSIYSHHIANLL